MSAAAESASAPVAPPAVPLTIHACNGRFLVWEAAVCRTLALEYRIIGEFTRNSKQIIATSNSDSLTQESISNHNDATNEGQNATSNDSFTVESLPMSLQAWQVLFLFENASTALDLRDGSSLTSIRAATIGSDRAGVVRSSLKHRLLEFQNEFELLAEHAEKMREKFQQHRKLPSPTATAETGETNQGTTDAEARPMKRAKLEENSVMSTSVETPSATTSVDSVEPFLDSLIFPSTESSLPLGSSLGVANAAQSLDASITAAPPQPTTISLTGRPSATIDRKVLVLDMKIRNSYKTNPDYQRPTLPQTESLLLRAICDSLGLPLDTSSISHPSFTSFLSLYSCFVHQWQRGYFILPGLHFGCDLVCYEDFPSQVHSTYLVRIMNTARKGSQEPTPEGLPLLELANLGRMATSINKAMLMMQCNLGEQSGLVSANPTDAFRGALDQFRSCQIDCSTCIWSYQPQLALQSFTKQHLSAPFTLQVR